MGFFDSTSEVTNINKTSSFNNVDYSGGEGGGGGGALAKNINLAESSLEVGDIISTDHGAVSGALGLADEVNRRSADTLLQLGDRAYDDIDDSRDFLGQTLTGVNQANREALQFAGQSTGRALAFAQKATRSEASQTVETLTKYLLIGGVSIAALIMVKGRM